MHDRLLPSLESSLSAASSEGPGEGLLGALLNGSGAALLRWFGPTLILLALMFVCFPVGWLGGPAVQATFAVVPRTMDGLAGMFSMPVMHGSWQHLVGNAAVVLVLSPTAALVSRRPWYLTTVCWLGAGLLTWLLGTPGAHIGASGIVYAFTCFLLVYGFSARRWLTLSICLLVTGPLLGGTIAGLIPQAGVSWSAHLAGAITGVLAALLLGKIDRVEGGRPPLDSGSEAALTA